MIRNKDLIIYDVNKYIIFELFIFIHLPPYKHWAALTNKYTNIYVFLMFHNLGPIKFKSVSFISAVIADNEAIQFNLNLFNR